MRLSILFCYPPAVDASGPCREVDADFIYMTTVVLEGLGVLSVINLLQGLIGSLVKFELKDIDIVCGLDDHVDTAVRGMAFHLCVETYHLEDDPHDILEV